jgi:RecA-family ATPase
MSAERRLRVRKFSEIESTRTDWLLDQRIPIGEVTLIAGMPGAGKTLWLCHLAALVSRGEFVNGAPSNVLFATAEDAEDKTLKPRLLAAGADMERVGLLEATIVEDDEETLAGSFRLPSDANALVELIEQHRPKLLAIDPLLAHLDAEVNSWKDESARQAMTPLTMIAQEYELAVVCALHVNKRHDLDPLVRVGGSLGGLVGPARSVFLFGDDNEDEANRLLVHAKHNLSPRQPTQVYRVETETVELDRGGSDEAGRLELVGETARGAEMFLGSGEKTDASKVDEAIEFLRAELADGPVEQKKILSDAHDQGISEYAVKAAKARLKIQSKKEGYTGGKWLWHWPMTYKINRRRVHVDVEST